MKDFEVTVSVRNNHLKQRRLDAGLSQAALAERMIVPLGNYSAYEAMRVSPVCRDGNLRKSAKLIAAYYDVDPEVLWPDAIMAIRSNKAIRTMDAEAVTGFLLGESSERMALPSGDRHDAAQLSELVPRVIETLTAREEKVLRMRFGIGGGDEHTIEEVGAEFEVTRERIRQIEAKALRKLRHPSRSKRLKPFAEPDYCEKVPSDEL